MMTESWRGVSVGCSSTISRSPPPKRSFDVAFLTGIGDSSASEEEQQQRDDNLPSSKVAKNLEALKASVSPVPEGEYVHSSRSPTKEDKIYGSAFTKVFKSTPSTFETAASPLQSAWSSSSPPFSAMSTLLGGAKSISPLIGGSSFFPLAPLLSPITSSSQEGLNNNLVEEYIKSHNQLLSSSKTSSSSSSSSPSVRNEISTSEALSRLRSSMVPPTDTYKLPFTGLPYGLGTVGTSNKLPSAFLPQAPAVSALIPPSLTNLSLPAQNVCAKCNISFRMTSDLVYHMRSQHKREPDLLKKRRNEKLKCPICGESFRERHHLTRHMTAHQDRDEDEQEEPDTK